MISLYMEEDHQRLDRLRKGGSWWEFRGGLLRHIGLEEKILLPDARRRRGGEPLPETARLREDHGILATLLVPPHQDGPNVRAQVERALQLLAARGR